jgi:putative copper resistance protein D
MSSRPIRIVSQASSPSPLNEHRAKKWEPVFRNNDAINLLTMVDWPLAAVRFGLYGALGLLFGMPLFVLTTRSGERLWRMFHLERVLAVFAVVSLALSLLGFLLLAGRMSGAPLGDLDPALVKTLLLETALGSALMGRIAALVVAFAAALLMSASPAQQLWIATSGAVAVATLAWAGHGAGGEGMSGFVHLGGDVVHLLAASTWLGALALLLVLVWPGAHVTRERAEVAHVALAGFSRTGTVAVALIVLTGVANTAFTVDATALPTLGASVYGRLLFAKLVLFAAMLGCAALNRYGLTPALQVSIARGELRPSLIGLRRSVAIETGLALAVFALVSWLGMLEPGGTS